MAHVNSRVVSEGQIRALIEDRVEAVRSKDLVWLTSSIAPDVVSFDVLNPLRYTGSGTMRQRSEAWFSAYQGPIGYEVRDLSVTAGDDVAFCHFLYRVSGALVDGGDVNMWVRATVCFRKIDGAWMVSHEHDSVPFDAESGRASLDLKP